MARLPDPIIERSGRILVVRDDRIPGGTKRRVIGRLLTGAREFVYPSTAYGYAQIALAYACRDAGVQATIFTAKRSELHPRTLEARAIGARIIMVPYGYMSNIKARARAYCMASGARLMPFGLDDPIMISALADVARSIGIQPREVWTVAGSGVLTRSLQAAWPDASFHAVRIGMEPKTGRASVYLAPERFEQDARQPPPFPSCGNYDAKAWRFIQAHAGDDALFWNVAA